MYILNKIVGWISSPLALAIIAAILGIVLVLNGKRRMGALAFGGVVAWIFIWSMPVMRLAIGVPLESEFLVDGRVPVVENFPQADAIVVLGGGMGRNVELSPYGEMSSNADRVWQAARLWKAGKAPIIISTGFDPKDSTLGVLMDFGVEEKSVMFLAARNTEEEAKVIRKQMLGVRESVNVEVGKINASINQIKKSSTSKLKVLLVTSAWHMKRARLMFDKYAPELDVVCAPADFEYSMIKYRSWGINDFLPDTMALLKNSIAVHEWIGLIGYKLFR